MINSNSVEQILWNLIEGIFNKVCRYISVLIKIGQK
jgi:hypothetical protein